MSTQGLAPVTSPEWPQTSTPRHQTEGSVVQQLFVVVPTDDRVKMGIIIHTLNSLVCFGIWTVTNSYRICILNVPVSYMRPVFVLTCNSSLTISCPPLLPIVIAIPHWNKLAIPHWNKLTIIYQYPFSFYFHKKQ